MEFPPDPATMLPKGVGFNPTNLSNSVDRSKPVLKDNQRKIRNLRSLRFGVVKIKTYTATTRVQRREVNGWTTSGRAVATGITALAMLAVACKAERNSHPSCGLASSDV
jgi:hypothetical protein